VTDLKKVVKVLEMKMDLYNMEKDDKLSLVLFDMAVEQILKISRILRQPRGNAMLIGVGGSGKQSLSKLAAFIMGSTTFHIEMTKGYNGESFRGDLQKLAKAVAFDQKSFSFIFTDLQIAYESFLEDINNLINTGEVPNLFSKK
jgi:dynein heavy chain